MEHPVKNPFEDITTFEQGAQVLMDLQAIQKAKVAAELAPEPVVAEVVEQPAEVRDIASAPSARRKAESKDALSARRRALISVAAAAVAVGAMFGFSSGNSNTAEASPQEAAMEQIGYLPSDGNLSESYDNPATTQVETIADRPIVFFAEQARPGSHHFGPEGEKSSPADALTNMLARDIADPMLLTGHTEEAGLLQRMTPEQRNEKIKHYMNDREAFDAAQKQFADYLTQDGSKISFSTFEGKKVEYYTMYAVPSSVEGEPPMVYQLKTSMKDKMVLRVDLPGPKEGADKTLYYKLDCGYQPVSPVPFKDVPELPNKPHETTTTTSTIPEETTTSTTVPKTTTTTSTTTTTTEKPHETTTTTSTIPEETTTSTTVPKTTTTTSTTTTTTEKPHETTTTTSTIPEETTTSTTVPKTTTTTSTTTTTTEKPHETTTTTSTIPPKHDDGELPGEHNEPGEPDVPGEGPAEQQPNEDGYLPGEVPVTPPETPPSTVPTTTTTVPKAPATTSPAPTSTNPPVSVTTVVPPTTAPENQMPEMP